MNREQAFDAIFYTAAILEYTARKTSNTPKAIAEAVGMEGVENLFRFADVDHCLSMEQMSSELEERYHLRQGTHHPLPPPGIKLPEVTAIGKSYAFMAAALEENPERYPEKLYQILTSDISDWMDDYSSAFFYSPTDYKVQRYLKLCS